MLPLRVLLCVFNHCTNSSLHLNLFTSTKFELPPAKMFASSLKTHP